MLYSILGFQGAVLLDKDPDTEFPVPLGRTLHRVIAANQGEQLKLVKWELRRVPESPSVKPSVEGRFLLEGNLPFADNRLGATTAMGFKLPLRGGTTTAVFKELEMEGYSRQTRRMIIRVRSTDARLLAAAQPGSLLREGVLQEVRVGYPAASLLFLETIRDVVEIIRKAHPALSEGDLVAYVLTHELGHATHLGHDTENRESIMGRGFVAPPQAFIQNTRFVARAQAVLRSRLICGLDKRFKDDVLAHGGN